MPVRRDEDKGGISLKTEKHGCILKKILAVSGIAAVLLFIIYIFNLDVKLIGFVYKLLGKHYDDMDRERKL